MDPVNDKEIPLRRDKLIQHMRRARFIANEFSKDRSTKVGMVAIDPESYSDIASGYNGMPRGVDESRPERHERPLKYAFFEHAERNAIFNRVRPVLRGSLCVTTAVPSVGCARAIVSVGAAEVYFPLPSAQTEELRVAMELFEESGVKVYHTFANSVVGLESRHARKMAQYVARARMLPAIMAKDPYASGTLFVSPGDYIVLAEGYSGMPRGANDTELSRYEGKLRQKWVEGSVRNAIYNAARPFFKGSVALVTLTTCVECARALASVGVRAVGWVEPDAETLRRWGDSFQVARQMLEELDVETFVLSEEEVSSFRRTP